MSKRKIEVIDINPKIRKEDAKHFMIVYFDVEVDKDVTKIESNTGHTYFELRDEARDKSDFYGKNPAQSAPVYSGAIFQKQEEKRKERAEQYSEKSGETVLVAKSLPLTKEQYEKAFSLAEAEKADPTIYSLVGSNCANFVQDIYSKVGLEGYFTENFTKEELTKISSWLSFHIKHSYPSANTHWYDVGFSRQEVAKKHKISLDRVEEVGGYGHSAVHEIHYFVIKPMEEILASKARDTAGLAQAAKTLEIMISPWAKFIQQGEKLSQEELQTSVVMSMNYFEHIKMQELAGGAYGHGFVSASGGIGALSNNVLYANAALCHGTQEGFARACSAKVMLAAKDAEARAAKVNISEAEIRSVYQEAFKAAGLSRSADLLALTKSISGSDKIYTLVPEVIDMLKSKVTMHEIAGNISASEVTFSTNIDPSITPALALSSIKNALSSYYTARSGEAKFSYSVFAQDQSQIGDIFGPSVQAEADNKYHNKAQLAGKENPWWSYIYEVKPKTSGDGIALRTSKTKGAEPMNHVDFTMKFILSPVLGDKSILSKKFANVQSVSSAASPEPQGKNMLSINIDPDMYKKREKQTAVEQKNLWKDGIAQYGHHHEVWMPSNVLNGDGATNVRPSFMVTDGWRPGASEVSKFSTDLMIKKVYEQSPDTTLFDNMKTTAMLNRVKIGSFHELNIDPLVIDLSGVGLKLTSWRNNKVLFDIDADGMLEETGWIGAGAGILMIAPKSGAPSAKDLLSEHFNEGGYEDGFAALSAQDANRDGVINDQDPIFAQLRVWIDSDGRGEYLSSNVKTLSELGIKEIQLSSKIKTSKMIAGNKVTAMSKIVMNDGKTSFIYSVDFAANPTGHKYMEKNGGMVLVSHGEATEIKEDGAFNKTNYNKKPYDIQTFIAGTESDLNEYDCAELGVSSIFSSSKDSTLRADDSGSWLFTGGGSNRYFGGNGDDTFVVSAKDKVENIDGKGGFNTCFIAGKKGMYLPLAKTNISLVYGSGGNDLIDAAGMNKSYFIQAGNGNCVIAGGNVSGVLAGGKSDDIIIGGAGGGIFRANLGNNYVFAMGGNSILVSGGGFTYLKGSKGYNVFQCNAKGHSICDGSLGAFNVVLLDGSIYDFDFEPSSAGVIVRNKNYPAEFTATLLNVHRLNFSDISNYSMEYVLPSRALHSIPKNIERYELDLNAFFKKDSALVGQKVAFQKIIRTVGCKITDENGHDVTSISEQNIFALKKLIVFIDKMYNGPVYLDYQGRTESSYVTYHYGSGEEKLETPAYSTIVFRGKVSDTMEYYRNYIDLQDSAKFHGAGVKVRICEISQDAHADQVKYMFKKVAPKSFVSVLDRDWEVVDNGEDVMNFSYSISAPVNGTGTINPAIQYLARTNFEKTIQVVAARGRGELGLPMIFAAGNKREFGGDTNYDLIRSLPEVITVGGIEKKNLYEFGQAKSKPFSNPGANILVSAPANFLPAVSQDTETIYGNSLKSSHGLIEGTSFAAPLVSGVVALMLEANSTLKLEDIKRILAYSSSALKGEVETSWLINKADNWNGGGLHFSHDLGFGCVNAHDAVKLAKTWVHGKGKQKQYLIKVCESSIISSMEAKFTVTIPQKKNEFVYSVGVQLKVSQLDIFALNVKATYNSEEVPLLISKDKQGVLLLEYSSLSPSTCAFLGEKVGGNLCITVSNTKPNQYAYSNVVIDLRTIADNNTNYIFTNEALDVYSQARSTITANNKFNTINLAPVKSHVYVNLTTHEMRISDKHYKLEGNFNNVICATGNSKVVGNELDNILVAGDGESILDGRGGRNVLCNGLGDGSFTTMIGGEKASMFVIRKSPNSLTVIENFKSTKHDLTKNNLELGDILNFVGFVGITSPHNLEFSMDGGNKVIDLPQKQKVLLKGLSKLGAHNFKFESKLDFISSFSDDTMPMTTELENLIYCTSQKDAEMYFENEVGILGNFV